MNAALFYCFAAVTLAGAFGVVFAKHIVHAAVSLMLCLLGVAALYFLLDAEFLAAAQLVIYVGGTLVLIVFGVMLTSNLGSRLVHVSRLEAVVAAVAGVGLLGSIVLAVTTTTLHVAPPIGHPDQAKQIGVALLSDYLLPFEIASVLMLAVMIGAAYLARRRPKDRA